MKYGYLLIVALVAAGVASAREEKKVVVVKDDGAPAHADIDLAPMEKVPVTFLGVETEPAGSVLATQLGLDPGTGLVITHVVPNTAAAAVLKQHDILTRFDDQILIDSHQLGVLVRSHKDGDEVALTVIRGGKSQVLKTKLGHHDLPKPVLKSSIERKGKHVIRIDGAGLEGLAELNDLPPPSREDYDEALTIIGNDRAHWFAAPPVHVFRHDGGPGSTVLSLADGNFVFTDDTGSVEVKAQDGKRQLTVKNPKGDVTFQGPINTEEERKKIPADVVARLDRFESMNVRYEVNDHGGGTPAPADAPTPPALREIGHPAPPY
ncbi:MAG TPA: PDZ domain-containing protein [Candidatus Didemnitutus sp.]|nr:PDZ domain-containing protein [Candidatus Didemnitutus sp.]